MAHVSKIAEERQEEAGWQCHAAMVQRAVAAKNSAAVCKRCKGKMCLCVPVFEAGVPA